MNKEKITALKNLLKEFDKIIARKKANVVKKEAFKIEIDGQEYNSEEEILEAYGCDIISEAQKETALTKYELWESGSVKDTLSLELKYLNNIRWNLSQELLEEEERK